MKTFREFLNEDAIKAQQAWTDWMKQNPKEFNKGGRFYEKGSNVKASQASKDFMKTYMKTGKPPAGFEIKSTKVPGQDVRGTSQTPPKQPSGTSQTPPKQPKASTPPPPKAAPKATQAPPKQPSGATPPPPKPPTNNVPAASTKPPTAAPKGPGLRSRLGGIAGPALNVAGAGVDYKARRDAGQSRARAAGGATSQLAGYAAAAKFGAMVPGPPIVKGAAAIGAGLVGAEKAGQAYDWAADKSRPQRQAVSKATGFDKFQQKNALIDKGLKNPSLRSGAIQRAQQTIDTRDARQVAAKAGTYGARQGSALTGIGGKTITSKDAKGNAFMSTGAGKQRQTVQLSKTQLVRDPKTGQQRVGDLAYKGGKATYLARPSVASRDTSLGARVARALNIGRYSKEAEQKASKQEYGTALKNTQTYQKKLGITQKTATAQKLPGSGVGPAKVGPKLVGPKIVGPKKVGTGAPQSPTKSLIKPA
jgi:hypothetical protein